MNKCTLEICVFPLQNGKGTNESLELLIEGTYSLIKERDTHIQYYVTSDGLFNGTNEFLADSSKLL